MRVDSIDESIYKNSKIKFDKNKLKLIITLDNKEEIWNKFIHPGYALLIDGCLYCYDSKATAILNPKKIKKIKMLINSSK